MVPIGSAPLSLSARARSGWNVEAEGLDPMRLGTDAHGRSALARYLAEIPKVPLLTREEEVDLALRARDGDSEAMNRLVEANLGFVVMIAARYRQYGVPFEDLLNEGNLGLIQAVQRFDASRGIKFITFAVWWIRKAILAALSRGMDPVRIPDYQRRKWRDIRRAEESLGRVLRRAPGREELARSLSYRPAKFDEATLLCNPRARSLDEPSTPEGQSSLGEQLADETAISGEEDLLRREAIELVTRTLARLRPQERRVLEYRYGLRAGNGLVLSEVGRRMSVSRERVRQIEVQAIRRMRRLLANRFV